MKLQTVAIVACAWTIAGVGSGFAQQAFASEFDLNKSIHLEGNVTKLEWVNPHVYAVITVPDNFGGAATWRAELSSPSNLIGAGMTRNTIQVGDDVVVEGFAAKAGTLRAGAALVFVKNSGISVAILPDAWHHSFAEHYDAAKTSQVTGRFVSIDWVNPHPVVHFVVAMPDGRTEHWLAELPLTLSMLNRAGWKPSTLNPGDEIQVAGAVAKDGSRKLLAKNVTLLAVGGRTLDSPRKLLD